MFERSFSRYTDERLGLAVRVRAHTGAPARHWNEDFESFGHKAILPREMYGNVLYRNFLTIPHIGFVLCPPDIPSTGGDDHYPEIWGVHRVERISFLQSRYLSYLSS